MSVFVKSIIQKPPLMFWKHCNITDINFSLHHFDQKNFNQNAIKNFYGLSNGILVHDQLNKKIFLINSMKTNEYSNKSMVYLKVRNEIAKVEFEKISDFPEFDICVLKCKYNTKLIKYCYNIEDIEYELSEEQKVTLKTQKMESDSNTISLIENNYEVEIKDIIIENLENKSLIPIPVYNIRTCDILEKTILNGSVILNRNNKIIGIISDYAKTDGKIYGIPSYCIRYVLNLINLDLDLNLKTIILKTRLASLDNLNEYYDTHYVVDNYGIKNKKERIIPKNAFILQVNNKKFNEKGMIYCEKIKTYLPLQTYILLHNEIQSYSLDIMYNNEKQTIIKINITPLDYKNYLTIPVKFNYKCLIIKGMVFIEANDEYIKSLSTIDIEGNIKNEYIKKYKDSPNKLIILVDILYDKISDELSNFYKINKLPFINIEKTRYYIPILKKINMENIKNFENININEKYIEKISNVLLNTDKNKDIKMLFNII